MTTPTREQIEKKARELYVEHCYRSNAPHLADITPELSELKESGFVSLAVSELMANESRKYEQYQSYGKYTENLDKTEAKTEISFNVKEAMDNGFFVCGTSQSGKTNLAKHLAKMLMDNGVNVIVLDTSQAWNKNAPIETITEINTQRSVYGWNGSEVYDLSMLAMVDRYLFVDQFTQHLFKRHVDGFREPEFIIFEEAQTYLPNGCMRLSLRKKPIYEGVLNLVTVGANYNLRFGLITQFPALVDKSPVKIAMQRYFGLTWEKNDVNYIKFFIDKEWAQQLKTLQKGEFIYQCRNTIERIQTPKFQSQSNESEKKNWFELTVVH